MRPSPYDDDERRARYNQWVEDQAAARLGRFLAKRPAKYAKPGPLNPGLAAWAGRYRAGAVENVKIVGNIGSGKTWNLWRLGVELIENGFLGRYEIVKPKALKRIITPPVDVAALDALTEADLVAFDDVAAIRVSDWDVDHLYGLIDDRWESDRPIIVSTNEPNLAEVIGERSASRLGDRLVTMKITGPDMRGQR